MVPELVGKYIFLVQTFVEAGDMGLSWPQLQDRWEARYGSTYARRSFANHRAAVEEVFGIAITCDRSTNRYRIDRGESAVDKREAVEYLINTFTVNSLLTLGKERLSGRVAVEDVPSGQKWLTVAMQALLDNAVLRITYHKYLSTDTEERIVRPYAAKEFAKRWYLVAWSQEAEALRTFALDRILAMERTGETFKMPRDFDVDALFRDSYGIYLPEGQEPVLVKLKATERESAYLRDLPLHPSQLNIGPGLFALRVIPNPNFIMELCKRADRLEVLEPLEVRQAVRQALNNAILLYEH